MASSQTNPPAASEAPGLDAVRLLVSERLGLELGQHNAGFVDKAIDEHMAEAGERETQAYAEALRRWPQLLDELLQKLSVLESWFFRDEGPFEYLAQLARTEWLPIRRVVRIMSLPCAAGEEPYSIAMALLDAGFLPERFSIDAVDVNETALNAARAGRFGSNSFRTGDLSFRDRYFTPCGSEFQLRRDIRESVRFVRGNVLDPTLAEHHSCYDAVFCRNLLIYLNANAKERCLDNVGRLLVGGGYLFVGAAEAGHIDSEAYQPVRSTRSFAFRKPAGDQSPAPYRSPFSPAAPIVPEDLFSVSGRFPEVPPRAIAPSTQSAPDTDGVASAAAAPTPDVDEEPVEAKALLIQARDLADRGDLEDAEKLTCGYIERSGAAAEAYCLLGLIRVATGDDPEAEAMFGKAVYLEPGHYDALVHLSLLAERRGDEAGAERFRRRAEDAAPQE